MYLALSLALAVLSTVTCALDISKSEEKALAACVDDFMAYPDKMMWAPQPKISPRHPFIFFHQRKAGGSSVKQTLFQAAQKIGLQVFIPCAGGVPCGTYNFNHRPGIAYNGKKIPVSREVSLFAGHFTWGEQFALARYNGERETNFACTTNYREPISRLVSCIYFRRLKSGCISDISLKQLHELLHKMDTYGTSCLNEPFYIMSGFKDGLLTDSLEYNNLDSRKLLRGNVRRELGGSEGRKLLHNLAIGIFNSTLRHTLKCAPLILEVPETYELVSNRFPDLGAKGAFDHHVHANNKNNTHCPPLTWDQIKLMQEHSFMESMLYNATLKKVQGYIDATKAASTSAHP